MKKIHTKAHYVLAILIAFSLPFGRLTPIFISLMLLNWLIEGDFKNKFKIISIIYGIKRSGKCIGQGGVI